MRSTCLGGSGSRCSFSFRDRAMTPTLSGAMRGPPGGVVPRSARRLVTSARAGHDPVSVRGSGRRGGELAAGPVDVLAAGVADRRRDAVGTQALDEVLLDAGAARGPLRAGRRVERNRVDVHPPATPPVELLAEQVGAPTLVVDVADEGVLDGHAT